MTTAPPTADQLIDAVIGREGGYSNHPADKGGPTRWGVTEQVARAYGYKADMKALPREFAVGVYRQAYWLALCLDGVAQRYPAVAAELFDIGVNMGTSIAGTFLQRCLNVLNNGETIYPDLTVDSRVGQLTLARLDSYRQRRGAEGGDVLLEAIRSLRGHRYVEISEARRANEAFTYGWFRRMVEMLRERFR
jgi:lysozyme family protein